MRKVSKKKAAQLREYNKLRKEFLEAHPGCQANIPNVCCCRTEDVHHKKGRIGDLLIDVRFWLAVCRRCHTYIETHPAEAKEKGWSLSRLAKNDVPPVENQ